MKENSKTSAQGFKGKTGVTRWMNAFAYSRDGIAAIFKTESAFREEILAAVILIPAAFFLPVSLTLKLLAVFSLIFLLVVELLNSAIEATIDRISMEIHPKAKIAKDAGSAAVLFALVFTVIVWFSVLYTAFF